MNTKRIPVYGFLLGSGKRLIAVVNTDLQAEDIYRKWKACNNTQRLQWVRGMQKAGVA